MPANIQTSRHGTFAAWSATLALTFAWALPVHAQSLPTEQICAPITEDEIRTLYDRWNASLLTKHPDKVTRNYAPDAVMMAETTRTPRANYMQIREHYLYFLQSDPQTKIEQRWIRLGCNTASDVGHYAMTLNGPSASPRETYRARYSFSYELRDGAWLIVHHHSSVMPGDRPAQGDPMREPLATTAQKPSRTQAVTAAAAHTRPKPQVAGFTRRAIARATRSAQDAAARDAGYEYRPAKWNGSEFKF